MRALRGYLMRLASQQTQQIVPCGPRSIHRVIDSIVLFYIMFAHNKTQCIHDTWLFIKND